MSFLYSLLHIFNIEIICLLTNNFPIFQFFRANLSTDYFTNRQDRYIFIKGSQDLTDFVEGLVDKISEFSFHLNSNNTLTLGDNCPPLKDKKNFNFAASSAIRNYYDSFIGKGKIGMSLKLCIAFCLDNFLNLHFKFNMFKF